jgi:hypothetical protein
VEGRIVASTTVGLAGDVASTLDAAASPADLAIHVQSLEGTLRARAARMRLLFSTLQAATKISLAIGTGNPLLALPAAARFIRGVMAEREARERAP